MGRALEFHALDVGQPTGLAAWTAAVDRAWPAAVKVFEAVTPETDAAARVRLATSMPELVPVLERLAATLDRAGALTVLSHTGVKPFVSGCSPAAAAGALVRNYDFRPDECDRTAVASAFCRSVGHR
jgi:hypothetical protein